MILIADSGSTKTEFRVVGKDKDESFLLPGINPFYQSESEIKQLIKTLLIPSLKDYDIRTIYFYGAGCAFPEKKEIVKNALSDFFLKENIFIESDLLAASRALFRRDRGVACILGTGSNSCLYDGNGIIQNVSPLGFILGDEGSGAVLGRKFISDCLKNQLPDYLKEKFFNQYKITPVEIMERVYKKAFPNRYLASLCPFLFENIKEEVVMQLVKRSFEEFFQRNVNQYALVDEKLGFVGSVAFYFQDILKLVMEEQGFQLKKILKSPIEGLLEYHKMG